MADKIFTSLRLKNKFDTYTNWTTNDPVLLAGEIALVDVADVIDNQVEHVPSILMKVGDGTKKFSELDWVYAKASNVHDWALAAAKPEYTATEIGGLATYIDDRIQTVAGVTVDTDTQYTLEKVTDYQYKLMSKGKDDASYTTEVAVIDLPDDTAAIAALEALVGNTSVADQIAALNTALTTRIDGIETRVGTLETTILGLSGAMHFKGVETALPDDVSTYEDGDVIIVGNKEYVFNDGAFVEFGDANASSQAVTDLTTRVTTAEGEIDDLQTDVGDLQTALGDKANTADLADVAFSGLWEDLTIGADTTIVIDCGTSAV